MGLRMTRATRLVALISLLLVQPAAHARQCLGRWMPGDAIPGVNGAVRSVVELPDGDLIVGGQFSIAGSTTTTNIARYHPASESWSALSGGVGSGVATLVLCMAKLPDGDVLVGGSFTSAGGMPASNVARYRPGTDSWIPVSNGPDSYVIAIAVRSNGDVIIGGDFTKVGTISMRGLAKYNYEHSTWEAVFGGVNGLVNSIAIINDAQLIVGGSFTAVGGAMPVSASNVARCNLETGAWTSLGAGTNSSVWAIAPVGSDSVLIGGTFSMAGGMGASRIARYTLNTSTWSVPATAPNDSVLAMSPLADGRVVVGGAFGAVGLQSMYYLSLYNPATDSWSAFGSGLRGTAAQVRCVHSLSNGNCIIGGTFATAGGVSANNVARVDPLANQWFSMNAGNDGDVRMIRRLFDGDFLVGGRFTSIGGIATGRLARYRPSDDSWLSLGDYPSVDFLCALQLPSGDVIIGGAFASIAGVTANGIIRFNPTSGAWSSIGTGVTGGASPFVSSIARFPDGVLAVGGRFTTAGGVLTKNVALYDPSTGVWSACGSGTSGDSSSSVSALVALPNDTVLVGGNFTAAGGSSARGFARYSRTTGSWSAAGGGVSDGSLSGEGVFALAMLSDDEIIVGGYYLKAGGVALSNIAMYSPLTDSWTPLGSGVNGPVYAIYPVSSREFVAGGQFLATGSQLIARIARFDSGDGAWSPLGSGIASSVGVNAGSVKVIEGNESGAEILVGGSFLTAGEFVSAYFARWTTQPECRADHNCSGGAPTVQDIFDFLTAWFAALPSADFNHSGPPPTVQDIFEFLAAWFAGC